MSFFGNITHGLTHPLEGGMGFLSGGGSQGGHLNSLFMQMQRQNALRQVQAQGYGLQGLRSIQGGYDQAIGNVGASGTAAKMGVENAGAQTQASIGQNLASRGLGNTTVSANLGGLAQGQTAQALAGIDQAMASAKANLLTQKGNAEAGAYNNLGNLALGQNASELGLGQMAWQHMANQPSEYQQLMQLLSGVGGLAGLGLGGMGGMGGAAAVGGMGGPMGFP